MELTRRSFIKVAGAVGMIDPIKRRGASHMKLSLAAYSFRARLAAIRGDTAASRALRLRALGEVASGFAWLHASAFRDFGRGF